MKSKAVSFFVFVLFSLFFLLMSLRRGWSGVPWPMFCVSFLVGGVGLLTENALFCAVTAALGAFALGWTDLTSFFIVAPLAFLASARPAAAPSARAKTEKNGRDPGKKGAAGLLFAATVVCSVLCAVGAAVYAFLSDTRISDGLVFLRQTLPCYAAAVVFGASLFLLSGGMRRSRKATGRRKAAQRSAVGVYPPYYYAVSVFVLLAVSFCAVRRASSSGYSDAAFVYPFFMFYSSVLPRDEAVVVYHAGRIGDRIEALKENR